jgi:hypothetical protein
VNPRASWLTLVVALSACGAGESTADAGFVANCSKSQAIQTVTSQSGAYTLYVCDAATPVVGFNNFTYLVVDQSGTPQDGLSLSIQPWMPYMNHGSPGTPTVTSSGAGQYQIANVVFQMAGEWQLRTAISAATSDSADPQFNID